MFAPSSWTYVITHPSSSSLPFFFATNWTPEQTCLSCKAWNSTEINCSFSCFFTGTLVFTKRYKWLIVQYFILITNLIWHVKMQLSYHLVLKQSCINNTDCTYYNIWEQHELYMLPCGLISVWWLEKHEKVCNIFPLYYCEDVTCFAGCYRVNNLGISVLVLYPCKVFIDNGKIHCNILTSNITFTCNATFQV